MTEGSDGFRAWYDYNGNMVGKRDPLGDEFVYAYDEENQLIKAVKNGTHVEEFIYDANGMRVRRIADGAATEYFFDGVNLLYEETAGVGTNYVCTNGSLLCTVKNSDYTYYHTDHLGTSKLQTDSQGKVLSLDNQALRPGGERRHHRRHLRGSLPDRCSELPIHLSSPRTGRTPGLGSSSTSLAGRG